MTPLPHQLRAVAEVPALHAEGVRRVCITSPTGGGKSLIAALLIEEWLAAGHKVILYTNRRMLVDQLNRTLSAHGLSPAIRAAGYDADNECPLQISSIATENARVRKSKKWQLFPADRVLIDEAHLQAAEVAQELVTAHLAQSACIVGLTATPIDIGHMYDRLVVAGTNSELRGCGLLVPSLHYGPDEPDMRALKRQPDSVDDLSENEARKLMGMMTPDGPNGQLEALHGRVWRWFEILNPDHQPTILFAPGVRESLWFAEQFTKKGVPAAHVDGQDVWVEGEFHTTSTEVREQVLAAVRDGRLKVLCNRFVLREGVDLPMLSHGIFATAFGSLQTYVQSGGRLLRSAPGKAEATIQDHGGNWWRWGSLNSDRTWHLEQDGRIIAGLRADRLRAKAEPEPARCPRCAKIVARYIPGQKCPSCQLVFGHLKKSRPVVTSDGELREMAGDIFRPRQICQRNDAAELWKRTYFGSFKKPRTFKQAEAAFAYNNNWQWPSHELPFMPIDPMDWYRLIPDVPRSRLK